MVNRRFEYAEIGWDQQLQGWVFGQGTRERRGCPQRGWSTGLGARSRPRHGGAVDPCPQAPFHLGHGGCVPIIGPSHY